MNSYITQLACDRLRSPIARAMIDDNVKEFYRIKEEKPKILHKQKRPDGVSPLLYNEKSRSTKFVDLEGKEIKPKAEKKKNWNF